MTTEMIMITHSLVLCPPKLLIPFVEDDGSKHEDRSAAQSRHAAEERREILEVNKVLCPVPPLTLSWLLS